MIIFVGKTGVYQSGALLCNNRLPVLPENIRLGWKKLTVAYTLVYYGTTIITAVDDFTVLAPGAVFTKLHFP